MFAFAGILGCVQEPVSERSLNAQAEPAPTSDQGPGEAQGTPASIEGCGGQGDSAVMVVQLLDFVREESTTASTGFNLDGFSSEAGDGTGCGHPDYEGPGGEQGIDNQFAKLLPIIEDAGGSAITSYMQDAITKGDLLLMFEFEGVDNWQNDDCVHLNIAYGLGLPFVGADGLIEPWQTFDIAQDRPWARLDNLAIVDGKIEAGPFDLQIPFFIFDFAWVIDVLDAQIEIELDGRDGASGMVGGAIPVANMLEIVNTAEVGSGVQGAVELVSTSLADLRPDEEGQCQAMSSTLSFESVGAFFYGDAERPAPTP